MLSIISARAVIISLLLVSLLGCISTDSISLVKRQLETLRRENIYRATLAQDSKVPGCAWFRGYEGPAYLPIKGRVCATEKFEIVYVED